MQEASTMITLRPAHERGVAHLDWLDSRHSFSFGDYYDPQHMGFASLRVINEDNIAPQRGFATHGHRDMEIVTYVLEGALEHKDSLGNGSIIRPGDVQRMSAGTGILHSEYNPSDRTAVHLLQIWILPDTLGLEPSYEQTHFPASEKQAKWCLIGSRDGREGSVTIHQDLSLYATQLKADETVSYALKSDRVAWIQVARGGIALNGQALTAGDGAAITTATILTFRGTANASEVLLFDMAP